jgi:hypothetical protein
VGVLYQGMTMATSPGSRDGMLRAERIARVKRLKQIETELCFPRLTEAQLAALENERLMLANAIALDDMRRR